MTTNAEKIYVWSKTDHAGKIVVVSEAQPDPKWLYFTDGSRIAADLVNDLLLLAPNQKEAETMSIAISAGANGTPIPQPKPVEVASVTTSVAPEPGSVMLEMLAKMSKKNTADMQVKVNIPTPAVYEMLLNEMDLERGDLNEQIGLLIENQINNLQEQLRQQISNFIINYYKLDKDEWNTANHV